jgi:hypothetical protein
MLLETVQRYYEAFNKKGIGGPTLIVTKINLNQLYMP